MFLFPTEIWIMIKKRIRQLEFNRIKSKLELILPLQFNHYASYGIKEVTFRYHKQYLICSMIAPDNVTHGLFKYDEKKGFLTNLRIPMFRDDVYLLVPNFFLYTPLSIRDTWMYLDAYFEYESFIL